jgi:hypothetical protein
MATRRGRSVPPTVTCGFMVLVRGPDGPGARCGPARRLALLFFPDSERTGPPVGGRPHSTARALPDGRVRGGLRDPAARSPDVDEIAADKNALFRRIRLSTRCQQKEQLRLLLLSVTVVGRNQARIPTDRSLRPGWLGLTPADRPGGIRQQQQARSDFCTGVRYHRGCGTQSRCPCR